MLVGAWVDEGNLAINDKGVGVRHIETGLRGHGKSENVRGY